MSGRRTLVTTLAVVAVTVTLDQISKTWAESALGDGDTIELLPTLEFDLAYNSGFSFSTGTGFGRYIGILVVGLIGFLGWQIATSESMGRVWILATIMGGAIGNLLDRLLRAENGFLSGEVIDFIDVTWYAVFNVADIFVVCGALTFAGFELVTHHRAEQEAEADPDMTTAITSDRTDGAETSNR